MPCGSSSSPTSGAPVLPRPCSSGRSTFFASSTKDASHDEPRIARTSFSLLALPVTKCTVFGCAAMDAAVRGKDATRRRVAIRRESAPAFRESDRERGTDTTRWNVDAALAIEECSVDGGEALFPFRREKEDTSADQFSRRRVTNRGRFRLVTAACRKCPKLTSQRQIPPDRRAIGDVSTSPRAETKRSLARLNHGRVEIESASPHAHRHAS